jgi:hypothetical protein
MSNSLNLQEVDQEQALNLSKFFIKSNQNLFLFGHRGIGKTYIALQAAQELNYKVNYINLSVIERPDLAGYPDIYAKGDVITYKSPVFLPQLLENSTPNTIILFDEIDKAPPEVTAPLLEILQFRKINDKPLNVASCILTGNLSYERSYSNLISTALLDRGAKYILSFNFDKWIDWAKLNNIHDLILGFLRSNPSLACDENSNDYYASPSPRGWTLASDALIKAKTFKITDLSTITQIISGFIGYDAGLKFNVWYEHYRKFEPIVNSLIESGNIINFDFTKLAQTEKIVFVIAACYAAKQKLLKEINKPGKTKFSSLENLCNFLIKYNVENEIQIMGLYNSFDFDMITRYKLYTCKIFFELFNKISENVTIKK